MSDVRRFRVYRDDERTRLDDTDDLLGWGALFPSGLAVVDWRREAFPEEDRLDHPHLSQYGSLEDVEQGTGGDVVFVDSADLGKTFAPLIEKFGMGLGRGIATSTTVDEDDEDAEP